MTEHNEIAPIEGATAYPVIGGTTEGLAYHLVRVGLLNDADAFKPIRRDALAILSRCRRFDAPDGTSTGLVVGYVQSGKTLSMAAVSALARDNGCKIIVLLAGVTTNLLKQNAKRLKDDLREASGKATAWRIFNSNDGLKPQDEAQLRQAVSEWRDPAFLAEDHQTFLFAVLKHHRHLDELYKIFSHIDLRGIPALVLDDEADQAGLNTKLDDPEGSTTYQRIAALRKSLPHHTYLQYTATPQAPLLIALDDMLSPAFAELLEPGAAYTGGQAFFGPEAPKGLVRTIPPDDLFKPGEPPSELPDSLLQAMREFFIGCAISSLAGRKEPRSMLIHPSPRTADHGAYRTWANQARDRWSSTLSDNDADARSDTLEEFVQSYQDLATTSEHLPPFDDLIPRLRLSLSRVSIKEVNSQDGSEIDWDNADDHILVGGEKLNRGFTVKGLTVTYMPRDAGDWNADTIQQRARFFGYKKSYLQFCRLYLHPDVVHAYEAYVQHEADIRRQLAEYRGRPLRDWRRAFFLDARMKPTRSNVLADPYYRVRKTKEWFTQDHPHSELAFIDRNRSRLQRFEAQVSLKSEADMWGHASAVVKLADVYSQLLIEYEVSGDDRPEWYGLVLQISVLLEKDPERGLLLVRMTNDSRDRRERGILKDKRIALQQGASSKAGGYPGDASIRDAALLTIQIHWLDIKDGPRNVPALAVHIPKHLREDAIVSGAE